MMNFQNEVLPQDAVKVGQTPNMTQETAIKGILKNHLAPKGKIGLVIVEEGSLQYVWEDDKDNVLDADKDHPIVIEAERYHHVVITGAVVFRVEFYKVLAEVEEHKEGDRPGEAFCSSCG
jgi:tellurite resistance-related uncharacterized protein